MTDLYELLAHHKIEYDGDAVAPEGITEKN